MAVNYHGKKFYNIGPRVRLHASSTSNKLGFLERLAMDKHSSLLRISVNNGRKGFVTSDPRIVFTPLHVLPNLPIGSIS